MTCDNFDTRVDMIFVTGRSTRVPLRELKGEIDETECDLGLHSFLTLDSNEILGVSVQSRGVR